MVPYIYLLLFHSFTIKNMQTEGKGVMIIWKTIHIWNPKRHVLLPKLLSLWRPNSHVAFEILPLTVPGSCYNRSASFQAVLSPHFWSRICCLALLLLWNYYYYTKHFLYKSMQKTYWVLLLHTINTYFHKCALRFWGWWWHNLPFPHQAILQLQSNLFTP